LVREQEGIGTTFFKIKKRIMKIIQASKLAQAVGGMYKKIQLLNPLVLIFGNRFY
jgi:hypothetical protein